MELVEKYFQSPVDFKNRFFPAAEKEDIAEAEELLQMKFADDFIQFLQFSNGFEGFINNTYIRLIPVDYIYDNTQDYCSEFYPWAVFIGTNAGGEMIVIDTRNKTTQFGFLPYLGTGEDFIALGNKFEELITRIYNDDIFED
jgi:hypothetical protein